MALNSKHPEYMAMDPLWSEMNDAEVGESVVKAKNQIYLPATAGQTLDGVGKGATQVGEIAYQAYKARAVFPDFTKDAVSFFIGVMNKKPPTIELPTQMEYLRETATIDREGLNQLLMRINEKQLINGRLGLLVDMPSDPDPSNPDPYIALYSARIITNWDAAQNDKNRENLNLVILDESGQERLTSFEWEQVTKYRVLILGDVLDNEGKSERKMYRVGQFKDTETFSDADMMEPERLGKKLEFIPFTFINSKDILPTVDFPPLIGLARSCFTIYRSEADYRQTLHCQGQDTLVVAGGTAINPDGSQEETRVGAGSKIDVAVDGSAEYIGISADGISEQRKAIENDTAKAMNKAGQLVKLGQNGVQSGESLKVQVGSQTATLTQIALSGAEGLEKSLRQIAEWMSLNADDVKVTPNLDFGDLGNIEGKLLELMQSRALGLAISNESLHKLMQDNGLTEFSFEEEQGKIEDDLANIPEGTGVDADD